MTYTAPELLLVGAAQNLVLGDSPSQVFAQCKRPVDPSTVDYDFVDNW